MNFIIIIHVTIKFLKNCIYHIYKICIIKFYSKTCTLCLLLLNTQDQILEIHVYTLWLTHRSL